MLLIIIIYCFTLLHFTTALKVGKFLENEINQLIWRIDCIIFEWKFLSIVQKPRILDWRFGDMFSSRVITTKVKFEVKYRILLKHVIGYVWSELYIYLFLVFFWSLNQKSWCLTNYTSGVHHLTKMRLHYFWLLVSGILL